MKYFIALSIILIIADGICWYKDNYFGMVIISFMLLAVAGLILTDAWFNRVKK